MTSPHDHSSHQAARELARVGAAALPDVDELAPVHLHAIDEAIRAMALPTVPTVAMAPRAGRVAPLRSRRAVLVFAAAMFVAVPSMAFAGALPDSVQHAAATAAANIGVDLPDPAADRATEATTERGSSGNSNAHDAQDDTGNGLGADTRGTVPGAPEPGEVRGNRFGQVEGGPDEGKAAAAQAAHPPANTRQPPTSQRPASPPGQSDDHGGGNGGGASTTGASSSSNAGGGRPADPGAQGKGAGNGNRH